MHLRSLTLKGFKSFPDRTRLTFSPGVSVVVGPNGSGKSNVTDAILWALGEQRPLAVRGQSMQDVIFAGGHGQAARTSAEVEVLLDDPECGSGFSEVSIARRLDRSGDGSYLLNGARCRLVDVLEVLSDTGLGKEMHSVISQGRVEQIVLSKPQDRRLLIEEAAGLGKHRKRRRRAELKLARTQQNLDRALDVEREARSRLRPLKRAAEAADLLARLERQAAELSARLTADRVRALLAETAEAGRAAAAARDERSGVEQAFAEVEQRRRAAEARFAARDAERRRRSELLDVLRSSVDRLQLRLEATTAAERDLAEGLAERRARLGRLDADEVPDEPADSSRIHAIEAALSEAGERAAVAARETTEGLRRRAEEAVAERERLESRAARSKAALEEADRAVHERKRERKGARRDAEAAAGERDRIAGELSAVEARLAAATAGDDGPALASALRARAGLELALTVALGERLRATLVDDVAAGRRVLGRARGRAGRAVVRSVPVPAPAGEAPLPGATPLAEAVEADPAAAEVAGRLLAGVWLVPALDGLEPGFDGVAVTAEGEALDGRTGEIRRLPAEATAPELAARRRAEELRGRLARADEGAAEARERLEAASAALESARARREEADVALRGARAELAEARDDADRAGRALEEASERGAAGPEAIRVAELEAELAAERRHAEQVERAARERRDQRDRLARRVSDEGVLLPRIGSLREAIKGALAAARAHLRGLEEEARSDAAEGEAVAEELRSCSAEEARLQDRLRRVSDAVTEAEVRLAHLGDRLEEARAELRRTGDRLGLDLEPADEPLPDEERADVERRLERLGRRREELGPVNPLAQREYEEAVAHVEELEAQRTDLEQALAEVRGVISECDRLISEAFEETYAQTALNFEEMVAHLFPGGRGKLSLVEPRGPRPVLGDADAPADAAEAPAETGEAPPWAGGPEDTVAAEAEDGSGTDRMGVEIEVMPAGKAMRRLSLLSGGEKSLVAIAFLFAVFLARPCPFYVLDEVEAALDDANIDRFLQLVRRYADRTQFIIVTHQKRTMDAADVLYGVTMGSDGVSKVVSRRLPRDADVEGVEVAPGASPAVGEAA